MDQEPADTSPNRGGSSRRNSRRPRAKIPLACQPCRNRKSRCDGVRPMCTRCQQRGLSRDDCVYRDEPPVSGIQTTYIAALQDRVKELEDIIRSAQNTRDRPTSATPPDHRQSAFAPAAASRHSCSNRRIDAYRHPSSGHSHHSPSPAGQRENLQRIRLRQPPTPYEQPREEAEVTAMGTVVSETGLTDKPGAEDHTFYGTSSAAAFIREACMSLGRSPVTGASDQQYDSDNLGGGHPASQQRQTTVLRRGSQAAYSLTLPPRSLADHLISSYFNRVYHLYPFFDRPTFEAAYCKLWESESTFSEHTAASPRDVGLGNELNCGSDSMVFHCALNAIFALACHFSDIPPADREATSDMFFQKTKSFLGIGLIEHNSLCVVQTLLIVALYLQSTAFPDRCWNSVGIACRLAQGLGLHVDESDGKGSSLEAEVRRRTWYCCVILDVNVSMTFGRPPMISTMPEFRSMSRLSFHAEDASERSAEDDEVCFFFETFRLGQILEEILRTIYQPWRDKHGRDSRCSNGRCSEAHYGRLDSTIELDAQLSRFEQSLPHFLSWTREADDTRIPPTTADARNHFPMQRNVLHGRFLYVRLMLYRPLLSRFWSTVHHGATQSTQGRSRASSPMPRGGSSSLIQSTFASECCKLCVAYSMQLISLTHQSFLTPHTTSWWWNALYSFTSGFVFILALSCPPVRVLLDADAVEQSWQQCQAILENISLTSLSVQKSLHLLRRLYDGMATNNQDSAGDVDSGYAATDAVDSSQEPRDMSFNADRFNNMDGIFAETIDTDMIETLFNSLGSGIAFGDEMIS